MESETELDEAIQRDVRVIEALMEVVPEQVAAAFPPELHPNTCILSTRVGMEAMRHFEIRCRALPVSVGIFNAAMMARITKEGRLPANTEESLKWSKEDGSWGLGVGETGRLSAEHNSYDGHLVLVAYYQADFEYDGFLIDLTLHQLSRPERDIALEPMTATLPKGFIEQMTPAICVQKGVTIRYGHLGQSKEWTQARDWRDPERRAAIVERVIAGIQARLDAAT